MRFIAHWSRTWMPRPDIQPGFIHRKLADCDIYFVVNSSNQVVDGAFDSDPTELQLNRGPG